MLCLRFCFPCVLETASSSGVRWNSLKFSGEASPTDHGCGSASKDSSLFISISPQFSLVKSNNISPLLKEINL